jgi:hypothetical protein
MTPAEALALSPDQRMAQFSQLAQARYGSKRGWQARLARDFGLGRRTIHDWIERDSVPISILVALSLLPAHVGGDADDTAC